MKLSTDVIVGTGLVIVLLASIVIGSGTELQTTIASGLVGYMGRAAVDHKTE